jgi:hypothetical protein
MQDQVPTMVRLIVTLSSSLGKLPAQASTPTNNFNRNNGDTNGDRRMSGSTMERKVGKKTCPWTTATAVNRTE